MKELSIEQRAKAYDYDKKVSQVKEMLKDGTISQNTINHIQHLFPELVESEDKKWRSWLIGHLEGYKNTTIPQYSAACDEAIAWLEKQAKLVDEGEQKSMDKNEPKFHEGEWIIYDNYAWQIVDVKPLDYMLQSQDGNIVDDTISYVDKVFHSFTIEDAKDGDVLATDKGGVFIYAKTLYNKPYAYCGVDKFGVFKDNCLNNNWANSVDNIYPATKEQRDLLFQKMHDAGYDWDAEKKELKEIKDEEYNGEDYGIDSLYHAQRILEKTLGKVDGYQSDDGILEHKCAISAVKKLYEQKPAWSKEDEKEFAKILDHFDWYSNNGFSHPDCDRAQNWLISLRKRIGG